MANFNFTVDTDPMASEIQSVSHHVDAVSGSVIAMQSAVVKAEREGADLVCNNVNKGFYSLMQSQISQKIAALTSQIEAKLMDMGQQAIALQSIQKRMERDYHMITNRYGKLFKSLNTSLYSRVMEIDRPVVHLIHSDMVVADSRVKGSIGAITTNQQESITESQLILLSRTKRNGAQALEAMHQYIRDVNLQQKQSEAVITDVEIENVEDIYIPFFICESTNELGLSATRSYSPTSNISTIDQTITNTTQDLANKSVRSGQWSEIDKADRAALDSEFSAMLLDSALDERVKSEISKLYSSVSNISQLNKAEL